METRELSREDWAEILARYEARRSSVTVRQFAEEEGVTFNAMVYRLYGRPGKKSSKKPTGEVRLVPVTVSSPTVGALEMASRWLELETVRGTRIRFAEGTGGEYVADLVSRISARGV
jgi:hypothetical protein